MADSVHAVTPPRRRLVPLVEAGGATALLLAYVALRALDAPRGWLEAWYVVASAFSVAFPYGGLLLVIPVGMFIGPYLLRPGLPAWTIWIVGWGLGVIARVVHALVRDRQAVVRAYRNPALLAGIALLAASALSVVTTWRHFGRAIGTDALYRWLWGPGTALLVLLAAAWLVRDGRTRPVVIAVATGAVGAVISLVAWFAPGAIRGGALDWMLGPQTDTTRLHGVTYLATGLEVLLIVPAAILAMALLYAGDRRARIAAAIALVPVALATWFTYNRAGLLGAYMIAVVAAWHARPRLGKIMAAIGVAGGIVVLPFYLAFRGATLGAPATTQIGQLLAPSDQLRIQAWSSVLHMWRDSPLLGRGFWSFFRLHTQYGSPVLDGPHNDWLRLFGEGGIVAGLAGIAFVAATAWSLSRGRGWLPRAALAAFACWVLALCFNNILSYDQVSIPLMVIVATGVALVRVERDGPVGQPTRRGDANAPGPGTPAAPAGYVRPVDPPSGAADTTGMSNTQEPLHVQREARPTRHSRHLGLRTALLAIGLVAGLVATTSAPEAARAVAQPYATDAPLALWEVPVAQVPTAPTLGTNFLIKSFSPGMNPVPFLDAAQARGWKVIFHFNDTVNYTAGVVYTSRVPAWVNQVKNHPALGGYLIVKEPSWSGISVAEMRSLRNAFRAADPDPAHLIYADYGDSPHFGTSANPWAAGIADVLIMNWYPVRISRGYVSDAVKWFPKMRAYVNSVTPGTPIWIMTQTFGASKYDQRTPTSAELERQVGEAFRYAGANGIVFYTWVNSWYDHVLSTNATLKSKVASLVTQIRAGAFVVRASYDTTRPVVTKLTVGWSATAHRWIVGYHATDIAGISRYQLRWRLGTHTYTYVLRASNTASYGFVFPRGKITIQARAQDRAGNWSLWRTVYRY